MKRPFNQSVVFAAVTGALLSCAPESDDGGTITALTPEELKNPEKCKDCHPKHYEQWSASMHAYASDDPVFLAMNKRGQEETGGTMREFCVNCHAPMAVKDNMITDFANPNALPTEYKGVTCYFCHNAIGVGDKHVNGMVNLANDNVMRAAVKNPVEPTTHKGETGQALWRTLNIGDLRVRMVDYLPGYLADHWCDRGHVIYVIDGQLDTELQDGRTFTLTAGMSYQVSDFGDSPHRSSTKTGAKLFIVD